MALNSISGIAVHILNSLGNVPSTISGALYEIADSNRLLVQNYTGDSISASSIAEQYQYVILNLAKADTIETAFNQGGLLGISGAGTLLTTEAGMNVTLGDMSVSESNGGQVQSALNSFQNLSLESAKQLRQNAMNSLKTLGRGIKSSKVIA